ncbi:MAG: hypothetical protein K2O78_00140 [Muribaculaceae bacterium]|nr:hypothetical protein [Muribaculaceae bacterium]
MAKKCTTLQKSVGWCQGTPEMPSIMRRVWYISKSDIVSFPDLPRDEQGRPTSAVLQGSFVLAADAVFKYIDILPEKSQHQSEAQGEQPSQTQINKLTLVHPGVGEEASALASWLNNTDSLFIFQDMRKNFRVVGNDRWTTKTTVAQDNGQGPTGTTATTVSVEVTDEIPSPHYRGTFKTEDGEIDCSAA